MPEEHRQQRRRTQDKGWHKWIGVVPIAFTLGTAVIAGVIGFTTMELTVSAQGKDIKSILETQKEFRPRVRQLESKGAAVKDRLDAIHLEQQRQGVQAREDRGSIIDALREIRQRMDRPAQ